MANRKNPFLFKRSNVSGKVPTAGDLSLGEVALNTADVILFTSGTTANSILPIGWDRVAKTGDTMTGMLNAPTISATTVSGTSYYGDGSNLNGIISGATNIGNGSNIFSSINGKNLEFRSITGNSTNVITSNTSGGTIELGINEPNMTLWPLVVQGNTLISGGATYLSGLTFDVSPLSYIIGTTIYTAPASQVTLSSGDTTFDRIDVIYADVSGNTGVVEGIPSSSPSKPSLDGATQVEITFVTVPANSASPDIGITKIYDENTGTGGGEWDYSANTTVRISGDSTNDAFSGTKSIEFIDAVSGDEFTMSNPTPYDTSSDNTISFYIKNITDWSGNREFVEISVRDSDDNINGNTVRFEDGQFGFDASNTTDWQVISIALGDFGMTSNFVSKVRFEINKNPGLSSNLDLYIDLIRFQAGAPTTSPQNIWLSFKGDDGNVAVANSSTDQLTLSGGTNINTQVSNTNKRVTFNLDNDISLNSVSATTISGGTLYGNGFNITDSKVSVKVIKSSPGTLTKGQLVYIKGHDNTINASTVELADADNAATTPAYGILNNDITDTQFGYAVQNGEVLGLNTSGFTEGSPLYLSKTPGEFTDIKPTGNTTVQKIGLVQKSDGIDGHIAVIGAGRSNDLPNLEKEKFWLGGNDWFANQVGINDLPSTTVSDDDYLMLWDVSASAHTKVRVSGFNESYLTISQAQSDYVNVTGDTMTGDLTVPNLYSTNVSATTYQNVPVVTGGTYSKGDYIFTNAIGGSFVVSATTNYSVGVISGATGFTDNNDGSITLPEVEVSLHSNDKNLQPIRVYTVSSGTTGIDFAALSDNTTNYVKINYNSGSPTYVISTDNTDINGSDIIGYLTIYRIGNSLHILEFGNVGAGLPNKLLSRIERTNRFARENGLSIDVSGSTGIVTLSSGIAWNASYSQNLHALNSQDDVFFKNFKTGGTWTYTTSGDTFNNEYYNDGTDLQTATTGNYIVNWYYRGQEESSHLYEVYGSNEYSTISEAELETTPNIPELISSHAFQVGRIIVEVGATTGYTVQSTFVETFAATQVQSHNDLTNLQGGISGEYFHLTSNQYDNITLSNVNNNFSGLQTFNELTASTISATTYYGDGSNLTGISTGETNTGANVGGGTGEVFRDKTGTTLNFKTLTSTGGTVTITNNTDNINLESSGGGGSGSSRITGSTQTTDATPTTADTITSISDNTTSLIEVYVKAYSSSASQWGVWKRTLTITKVSGTITIREENADVDKTSNGLNANSIDFIVNGGDISIQVTGIADTTIDWNTAYEIIL